MNTENDSKDAAVTYLLYGATEEFTGQDSENHKNISVCPVPGPTIEPSLISASCSVWWRVGYK
jgi:hypothetical protein